MTETKWMKTIKDKYNDGISNVFVVTGNIGDYAVPGMMFMDYLVNSIKDLKMNRIYSYDISKGKTYRWGDNANDALVVTYDWEKMIKGIKRAESHIATAKRDNWEDVVAELRDVEEKISEYRCGEPEDDWEAMLADLQGTEKDMRIAYIFEYPEFLIGNGSLEYMDEVTKKRLVALHKLINGREFLNSNNLLVFVTEVTSNINNVFINSNSRAFPVNVDYPDEKERLDFIRHLERTSSKTIVKSMDNDKFAKLTAGLTRVSIEDIYLMAEASGVLDKKTIMDRKKELIMKEFGEVIEILDTDGYTLDDFAGQEHIKEYHREVVINPIMSGDPSIVPMGILYCGAPGTGKSYFTKCFAGEAGINFIEFKMSKILDKYVGEAEKRLEKAFNCFEANAPVAVFMDELDQMLNRGENDTNSVMKNIFGMFLAFLSKPSHRGNIIFIGASNYPNKLDEALKRAGRFDKKIPFLPPEKEERKIVFQIHLKKGKYPYEVKSFDLLADKTEGYTPAEIENVVIKALEVAKRKKLPKIQDDTLLYAIDCVFSAQNSRIKEMTELAINECNDLEFLPPKYREIKKKCMQS